MLTPPFESLEALQQFIAQSSRQQFQKVLPHFSLTEIADALTLLHSQAGLDSHHKLEDLFQFIDSPAALEMVGKKCSPSLFIRFLDFIIQHPRYQNRLNCVLIGLLPTTFSKSLHAIQEDHLRILRQDGLFEPLHYQLTQFIHEGEELKKEIEIKGQQLKAKILSVYPIELNDSTLQSLTECIDKLRDQLIDYLERASTALAIVWHTSRIDLIEKLSIINESTQHELNQRIGHPSFENLSPTRLYLFLEETLGNIFDSSLNDDDSAIDGMTRLDIWHLKDYWDLGLLPSIHHVDELNLAVQKEKGEFEHHQHLIHLIPQQLQKIGIRKVKDLKRLHLFSKPLLKSYIEQHRDRLI